MRQRRKAVLVVFEEIELCSENGKEVPGLLATCRRCDYNVSVFGIEQGSENYAFVLLHQGCPNREHNYYANELNTDQLDDWDLSRNTGEPHPTG
jgi:hypothetical protein